MTDECLPAPQMRILENCGGVVELKVAVDRADIGHHGDRAGESTEYPAAKDESIHGVVILHNGFDGIGGGL